MSSQSQAVRSRRSPASRRVALTRASSPLGSALAGELIMAGHSVVGIDSRSAAPAGPDAADIEWRLTELTSPQVAEALRDVDVVVHLAHGVNLVDELTEEPSARRARLIREVQTLTVAVAAAGVGHLIVVTSAMIYGARSDNPVPLPEDTLLRSADTEGMVADLMEVEELLERARLVHPNVAVTAVRPAPLVGPRMDSIITRHFEAPRLLRLKGTEPRWQFCHVQDLASALDVVLRERLGPGVMVGAPGSLTQDEVEQISGLRPVTVAAAAAHGAAERLHRLGVLPLPATDLAYVSNPWVVDPQLLLAHGWRPAYDNRAALLVMLEQVRGHRALMAHRLERKDAVLGAAGAASAAVAAVATAALLRRRRARG